VAEVARARVACANGLDLDWLRWPVHPQHTPVPPAGLDPCGIPDDVLATYSLGIGPVSFKAPAGAAGHYVPLLYSKSAVDRHAETVLTLLPGRGKDVSAR